MNVDIEYTTSTPHGGALVDRRAPEVEREERKERALGLRKVTLGPRTLSDLEMVSTGVFSPLTGFMAREGFDAVGETMDLAAGLAWSMQITHSGSGEEEKRGRRGEE